MTGHALGISAYKKIKLWHLLVHVFGYVPRTNIRK